MNADLMSICLLQDTGRANYLLEVKIHSYSNPSHLDANGYCCDYWHFCNSQCDNTFQFCPFNFTSHPTSSTDSPSGLQSLKGNDSIEELDKTLVFNGASWPVSFQNVSTVT